MWFPPCLSMTICCPDEALPDAPPSPTGNGTKSIDEEVKWRPGVEHKDAARRIDATLDEDESLFDSEGKIHLRWRGRGWRQCRGVDREYVQLTGCSNDLGQAEFFHGWSSDAEEECQHPLVCAVGYRDGEAAATARRADQLYRPAHGGADQVVCRMQSKAAAALA